MIQNANRNGELKIRISGLSEGHHEYHFSSEPSLIGLDDNFQKPVEVLAQLEKTSRQFYVKVAINSTGRFQCDRCLEEFHLPISTDYKMCYVYTGPETSRYPVDEIQMITPDAAFIDLKEDVRQMIILSIPLKLLCSESCKGLCPKCGMNWNHHTCSCKEEITDPRLQDLKDLLHS